MLLVGLKLLDSSCLSAGLLACATEPSWDLDMRKLTLSSMQEVDRSAKVGRKGTHGETGVLSIG